MPDAAWRDAVGGIVVVVGVIALAAIVGPPPLDKPPDPSIIQAQPRPDWYMLWYFAVLALVPHEAESYVIILGPLLAVVVLFLVPLLANRGYRHPTKRPLSVGVLLFILACIAALWIAGINADWSPKFDAKPLTAQIIGTSSGLVYQAGQVPPSVAAFSATPSRAMAANAAPT